MKQISRILRRMEASLNGSLDGIELDNVDDVIEKSLVIDMVNDLKTLVNEAQAEVKNLSSNAMLADRIPNAEDVKRWYQLLVGKSEEVMQKDIEATFR